MLVYHTAPDEMWFTDQPVLQADDMLGYRAHPGFGNIKIVNAKGSLAFSTQVGSDGFRLTRPSGSLPGTGKKIYIFGMSYNYGWGVDTERSFPWLVQESLPDCDVRNYGVNAYSHLQNLLWFLHLLETDPPDVAVFSYARKQRWWNVANPSFLKRLVSTGIFPADTHYLRAGLCPRGTLQCLKIPMDDAVCGQIDHAYFDADEYYVELVTQRIFHVLDTRARERGIGRILLTFEEWNDVRPMADVCARMGWVVVNGEIPHTAEFMNLPMDAHANDAGNRLYADRLLEALRSLDGRPSAPLPGLIR